MNEAIERLGRGLMGAIARRNKLTEELLREIRHMANSIDNLVAAEATVETVLTTLDAELAQLITDYQTATGGSNPAVDAVTTKLQAVQASLATLNANIASADPAAAPAPAPAAAAPAAS